MELALAFEIRARRVKVRVVQQPGPVDGVEDDEAGGHEEAAALFQPLDGFPPFPAHVKSFIRICFCIFDSIYWPWLLDGADFYAATDNQSH